MKVLILVALVGFMSMGMTFDEVKKMSEVPNEIIQSYAQVEIAKQLTRIADSLEKMSESNIKGMTNEV